MICIVPSCLGPRFVPRQAQEQEWWPRYFNKVYGKVEVATGMDLVVVVHFPRLPYCQPKYHTGSTKEEFIETVDRENQDSKHLDLCLRYPDVEVRKHAARGHSAHRHSSAQVTLT